ncbi:autotransporter outer membrane beta-barrel domain-containing protein [Helicobacter macacae]|uniref:Autotransporter domain-containing protein n=1 Tax=Helicobacter macacae MIT 99-5501 TaxID=1357400 RepID=V8CCK5_9HELI|nr:hypothetical protein [Helicobacter macacae]ETD25084.1 hypothetical protein HMPREF2086_00419 [Helicobacter macacae MIT 99-5501]
MIPTKTHLAFAKNALISLWFYTFFVGGGGSSVYAFDYIGRLPSSITLNGGESQTHNAVMNCSSYWECVFGDYSYSFTYSTNGDTDSTLTLNATLPPNPASQRKDKPFFIGTMTINPHSNLIMQGFESFNLGNSLTINSGSLSFKNGDFATLFNTNIRVTNGGNLSIEGKGFTNRGSMSAQNATISITASSARNYGSITNNGGDISIRNTSIYNIGQKVALAGASPSSVANITNNGGTITIGGSVYNGGQENSNIVCQVSGCGGGNITNYGGTITITGQLISEPKDGQSSSIGIYGGTLSATGGVQNKSGSTLTIGALNGVMGKIQGNVTNSGQIIIDAQGASGGTHQFITGTLKTGSNISLINGNTEFATSSLQNQNKTLTVNLDTAKIASFTSSLEPNQKSTLNALGSQIYTTNGATSPRLTQSADLLNQSAFTLLSAPFSLISILKSNLSYPISYTSHTSKIKTNSLEIGFIGGILQSSSKISGGGGGVRLGYAKDFASYFGSSSLEIEAGYIYSAIKDNATSTLLSYGSSLTSHTAGAEAIFFTPLTRDSRFGLKVGLGGFMTFIDSSREVDTTLLWGNPSLKSSLSLYQVALDSSVGYEVVRLSNFIATPYLGLHQSVNILPSFAESSEQSNTPQSTSIALKTQGYKAYHLGLIVGLEAQLRLRERAFGGERTANTAESKKGVLLGKIEYEYLAFSSQKSIDFAYPSGDFISFGTPHSHKVRGALGFQKDFTNGVTLGVEASIQSLISTQSISKTLGQSLYFYGANATVGYRF